MPRLSSLARGYGTWSGDLEQEADVSLKGFTKPILPQYLSKDDQPFYTQKTVKFPIRTKSNHVVIKTIIAEAERIKSAKSYKHGDPPTVAEEIQSNVPMTQPSREQSSPSQRCISSPEFRTNHKRVKLRTRSAPAAIKPNGEMKLPKTYITRKGAMVLFTAPSKIKFTKEGRCFSSNTKTKKDINKLSLSLGTLKKLCTSVLQYGEPTWTDDDLDSLASQQFHKTCMRFIRDEQGEECFDYRVQPGADFNFYLNDVQRRNIVQNLTRCGSAHSLTSTEAAEELNEALENVDVSLKHDEFNEMTNLITADAQHLVESMSCASTLPDWNKRRPSTTQGSERKLPERVTRMGSDRSISSAKASTSLSCAKLTASLKSTNYLGRSIIAPLHNNRFVEPIEDDAMKQNVDDEAGDSEDVTFSRQQSGKCDNKLIKRDSRGSRPPTRSSQSRSNHPPTRNSRPSTSSRATDGSGDAGNDPCIFDDESLAEMETQSGQDDLEDAYNDVMSVEISLIGGGSQANNHGEHEINDDVEHPDDRSSQMSRRSRRSSSQRIKSPASMTSRRSSTKIEVEDGYEVDEDQTVLSDVTALSRPDNNNHVNEEEQEILQNHICEDAEGIRDSIKATTASSEFGARDVTNSRPEEAVTSRPLTAESSHHSVLSFHCPASGSSVLESSVDFNDEQQNSLDYNETAIVQDSEVVDKQKVERVLEKGGPVDTKECEEQSGTLEGEEIRNRQSVKSASIKSMESDPPIMESKGLSLPLLTSHPPNDVPEQETSPSVDGNQMKRPSLKRDEQPKQFIKISEPKPPPPRIPSAKTAQPILTPKSSATKVPTPQPPLMKKTTPVHAGTPVDTEVAKVAGHKKEKDGLDLFSLKTITNKPKSNIDVKKKKVIGGPQVNDSLLKEAYEEPGADEVERMIQEELEKDLKEKGLISEKTETEVELENPKQEPINLDTDDEAISKEVKQSNKGKKKSKKQILKEREELRELRRREKKLKEEEAKALKAKKKAEEEEKRRAEEEEKRKKIEMEEEMQEALREAEAAKEAEEQARLMLLESRKLAREEREAKRKAEMERKKEERNRQREERKKMEEAARKREQEMKDKLASVEDIIRQKELERELEWEREEKEREEREELERLEEEEKRRLEEEEERIRELEKEAEEEALSRLVKERKEAEERMKQAAIEAQKQKEREEKIRLEKQHKREQEAEERRLQELEKERLLEIERQRILQIKKIEEEARAKVLKKLEGQRIWAMRRREANMERFSHLNSVRRTQGVTRPWVFSYYVHWPRQTYEKKLNSAKKKQRRPTRPKPPTEKPVEGAS